MSTTLMGGTVLRARFVHANDPGLSLRHVEPTVSENVPRHHVSQVAVVKARTNSLPAASRMLMLTVASNTSALPRIVNGLETSSPGRDS